MFGALNNIDMSGLFGLSADMSPDTLYGMFRSAIPAYEKGMIYDTGATDSEIHSVINSVFGTYEVRKLSSDPGLSDSITEVVQPIVLNTVGTARALQYKDTIFGILANLKQQGLYLVPKGYAQSAPPVAQSPVSTNNIVYQGAVASQQAGRQSPAQSPTQTTTGTQAAPIQIVRSPKTGLPVIYRRQSFKQTPADRQRLYWIIGGFGIAFALAIGVIAARSSD